jgi:hypothetical protein
MARLAFYALVPLVALAMSITLIVTLFDPSIKETIALSQAAVPLAGPVYSDPVAVKNAVFAQVTAKAQGVRIEVLSKRTEDSTT